MVCLMSCNDRELIAVTRTNGRGFRWYRFVYRMFYGLGLRICERGVPPSDLVELVEGPEALPPGRALDLGCGTGTDSVYLATQGWDVTGVDMVPRALAAARRSQCGLRLGWPQRWYSLVLAPA